MFGEKPIFGQNEITIDNNGRMFVPANTKREAGEELVLLYNENLKLYEMYSVEKLKIRFEELENLVLNAKNKKEKVFYEKMILELSKSILKNGKVDSQGRFSIGMVFEPHEKLFSTGAYDHLIIERGKSKK